MNVISHYVARLAGVGQSTVFRALLGSIHASILVATGIGRGGSLFGSCST